jgi:protein phosphatase
MNRSAGLKDRGNVRPYQEDDFRVSDLHGAYAVADGMGGHRDGEVASRLGVEAAIAHLIASNGRPGADAKRAVLDAHAAVVARSDHGEDAMGSTLVVYARRGDRGAVAWVGDSRAYVFKPQGQSMRLERVTKDHGIGHFVERALGHDGGDRPEAFEFEAPQGTVVLLCTDGLTKVVKDRDIVGIMNSTPDLKRAAQALIDAAKAAGGPDNITIVLTRAER